MPGPLRLAQGTGVIDPAKIVGSAPEAAWVAGLLIITEATIAEPPQNQKPAAGMSGGGMGF